MVYSKIFIGISQKESMWVNKGLNTKHNNTKADNIIKADKDISACENTAEVRSEKKLREEFPIQFLPRHF